VLAGDHALVPAGIRSLIEKIPNAGPRFALLMLALVSPGAVAQVAVETPRTIRVVMDNAYAPYSFQSDGGKLQGILVDQWRAWEKTTGIKVEIHALDWGEALRRMRAGEFDVIDSIVETSERRNYFDFTPTYATIEASIFFRSEISGITDIASLKGFPVGAKAGDQHVDKLKASGVTTVILFQNYDAMIEAAKQHKINVFVIDNPSALYLLNKAGIEGEFRHSAPLFRDELRRAVRKGDAALLRTVSDGFAAIEPAELKQINEKWFGRTINRIGRYLTYAGYTVAAALLIIAGLAVWNRTLRKKVLQRTAALGDSEQRFRRLVELMPVAVYVCDTSGKIQIYNHRAVELWGREPKSGDAAQRYCASLRLWSPEGMLVPHEESKMAEVLQTGVPANDHEVVIERPDGSRIAVLVNIAPLRNADGELVGAMNCFQDITERKQAEDRLRRSEEKFKALFGIAPVGISVLDRQHNVVDANPALEQITRLSKEELLNGTHRRRTYLNADGTPKPPNEMASKRAITENRPLNNVETGIVTENGEIIWTQVSVAPLAFPDASAVVITQDITERKRAELALDERLRFETLLTELSAAFANLPTTKVDQEIDKWLQNLVEFLDLDRAIFDQVGEDGMTLSRSHSHTARGIDTLSLNVADDQTPWITEQLLRGNTIKWSRIPDDIPEQASQEKEFAGRIGAKSVLSIPVCIGGAVICAVSFTSMRIYRDWPDEMVARLHLVGEIFANAIARKRAAKELEEANRQLRFLSRRLFEIQEEERRHLARELHDEIGQALTAAKINLQSVTGNGGKATVARVQETTAILDRLLNQVRQISLDLRPSMLDDLGLVPALRSLLDQQGRRASVAVRFSAENMPEKLDPEIQTTCFRIAQEAITNAVRHADAKKIDVDLRCENEKLRLRIRDNGIGFDVKAAQAQTVGLGLIGIKERAVLVGGRAKIISSPNKGTTIEVSLPLTDSVPAPRIMEEVNTS
jgi:PAS domain S-box-containing protein